jgi:hypothetical protein
MSRSGLKFLAILLSVCIVAVLFAGLDDLPRTVRAQIAPERAELAAAQQKLDSINTEVAGDIKAEPELFRWIPPSQQYFVTLGHERQTLQTASSEMAELSKIEKANRRGDKDRAEQLLARTRAERESAIRNAEMVEKDAAHWISVKQNLPTELKQMDADYAAIHGFDTAPLALVVQRAETDWPDKKSDLDSRLNGLRLSISQADTVWQKSADLRRAAAAQDFAHLDFAAFASDEDSLHTAAEGLPHTADEIKTLTAQLYTSWDKLLVDMRDRHGDTEQEIRTVATHFPDAAAKTGDTTSNDDWVKVPQPTYKAMQNDLGMAVEHKNEGFYDSEAEHVAQPAGFAYMAPPGQTNQYGYWDHHDGRDFWVFYGQYALLRDLLFNHSYRPLDRYEWDGYYESWRHGRTYYGNDQASGAPRYGSQGTATQERYSGSNYAHNGGFKNSPYASKPGNFRSSPYASQGGDNSPHRFGSGSGGSDPHAPPSRGFRPAPSRPAPSFRPPSSPRRFGKH